MIIKFYFIGEEREDLMSKTPWKTIIPPSGDHTPLEYFLEDPQCESISEDEVAFFFNDHSPIAAPVYFKNGYGDWSTVLYDVNMFYRGGE